MRKFGWIIISILVFTLIIRFFRLDKIPGEWYGDISNVHEYEMQVLRGEWPFYFFQSPGPLYHYLIAPVVLLYKNHGFETYKAASIAVSILGLAAVYLLVAEISSVTLALLTSLTMSVSMWYLIWSRLGNSQIVIPALVSLMSLFIARYVKKRKLSDLFPASIFASLGWYTYPQTFIFPAVFFLFIVFYLLLTRKLISQFKSLVVVAIALAIMVIPFLSIIKNDKGNFGPQGYVGEKVLPVLKLPIDQLMEKTLSNYQKVILMLHVKGDVAFRVNISNHPLIDKISGIFFLLGFLYFARKKSFIWLFFILFILLTLPLPSVSPAIPDIEIPNSARAIAVIPFVFLLVSAGILWTHELFNEIIIRHSGERSDSRIRFWTSQNDRWRLSVISTIITSFIYGLVVFSNLKLYFVDYTNGLPDKNLAPGKIIAKYIDKLPLNYSVYFTSCCWGEWGEPEPKGVVYQLHNQKRFMDFSKIIGSCDEILYHPAVVVTDLGRKNLVDKFMNCSVSSKSLDIVSNDGILVSKLIFVN